MAAASPCLIALLIWAPMSWVNLFAAQRRKSPRPATSQLVLHRNFRSQDDLMWKLIQSETLRIDLTINENYYTIAWTSLVTTILRSTCGAPHILDWMSFHKRFGGCGRLPAPTCSCRSTNRKWQCLRRYTRSLQTVTASFAAGSCHGMIVTSNTQAIV